MGKVRRIKSSVRMSRALTAGSTVGLDGRESARDAWAPRDSLPARADQERASRLPD